jgi:hypothetical protein
VSYPPDNLNWDRLKADIRRAADCVDVYESIHPEPAGKVRDGGTVRCIDPQHEDRDPSMSLHTDGYKCHGCGASGDIFDMWALTYGRSTEGEDFKQTAAELADYHGFNLETYTRSGDTGDVERPQPPTPVPQESEADGGDMLTANTTDPPDVRRDVFTDVWSVVQPLTLTPEAETWLESRSIPPHVAYGYGCRDWRPAMGDLFDVLRNYTLDELHRAGMVNGDGEPWWPLRAYQQGNEAERGLAIPVWHPDCPEAPIAVRWRTYSPDAYRKAYQQPSGPGRFQQPPLGLCEPAPETQVMLGASWLNAHVDVETARNWMDDDVFRPVGAYPSPYAVVLCEGETDWLSVGAAALELDTDTRIVPVALTAMAAEWRDSWTDALENATRIVVAFDRGTGSEPAGEQRTGEIIRALARRHGKHTVQERMTVELRTEDEDLNDLRAAGALTDRLRQWLHLEDV